jgi:uncharacterized protein
MKHYLLFYEGADDYLTQRANFRTEHLAKAWKASQRGELLLGGALADPIDGAVLLFKGESPSVAEDFARADPYVTGGMVKRWYVREWTTVVGDQAISPVQPDSATPVQQSTPEASDSSTGRRPAAGSNEVLRLWRGRATAARAIEYLRHVSAKVFPQIESIPGHRGAFLLRRPVDGGTEFLVLTLWASMDAVGRFAGPDPDRAVVEPAARAALSDFDEVVTHYEVVVRPKSAW